MSMTPSFRAARLARHVVPPMLCAAALLACGGKAAEGGAPASSAQEGAAAVEKTVEKAVDEAVEKAGAAALFDPADKELRKRACGFLTPEMVSSLFDVPAGDLKQMKMMGCMYSWSKDDQVLNAQLMTIRVHKTAEIAETWFGNATATRSKAELDEQMNAVKERVKEREELDTKLKKKTAGKLTDIAKLGTPDEGVSYEDVPGLADQARVSSADGVIWVRLNNMTFQLGAYKGPAQPKFEFDPKNLKGIAKAAMEAQKAHIKDTLEQRKKDALKLAPRVIAAVKAGAAG